MKSIYPAINSQIGTFWEFLWDKNCKQKPHNELGFKKIDFDKGIMVAP